MTDYYVLHSGGMDSTTALTLATNQPDARRVYAVGVNYGQRHVKELQAAEKIREQLGVTSLTLDLTGYGTSVTSALTTDDIDVPDGHYADDNMKITVVPGRNAVMLTATAGLAASLTEEDHPAHIVCAVHAGDHAVYPDCRPEFISSVQQTIRLGVRGNMAIWSPFVHRTKTDIARIGDESGAPLGLSWSCYKGRDKHCGTCGTCVERREAFHDAGVDDPTEYATAP